ncbi:hypothetical protein C8T65DRAFT_730931 [Cerioporus squamosus]|nr:hypothetical protein C8T65DRAFT_730931 [Cerioporus squamosus]
MYSYDTEFPHFLFAETDPGWVDSYHLQGDSYHWHAVPPAPPGHSAAVYAPTAVLPSASGPSGVVHLPVGNSPVVGTGAHPDTTPAPPAVTAATLIIPTVEGVGGSTLWTCPTCGKHFSRKGNVRQHWKEVHDPDFAKSACLLCKASYKRKRDLDKHVKAKHT